jgi:hypothetical protein
MSDGSSIPARVPWLCRTSIALLILNVMVRFSTSGGLRMLGQYRKSERWDCIPSAQIGKTPIAQTNGVFLLLNAIWGLVILRWRQWSSGRPWLLVVPIWLIAVVIDFAHH